MSPREINSYLDLVWIHVECKVCFEDVLGVAEAPASCPLCGNRQGFKATPVGMGRAMEIMDRLKGEPYYERKKAWKLKDTLKEYADKHIKLQQQKKSGGTNER